MIKQTFAQQGFVGPVKCLTPAKIAEYTNKLEQAVVELDLMNSDYRCKANVLFPWIDELSRNPIIHEHVREILGDDFHCWDTLVWIKEEQTEKYVSWHQDATYWNFLPKERGLTVWVTLSGATKDMGCIQYIPGSHKQSQIKHNDIQTEDNLLMRGQTITYKEGDKVYAEAEAGDFLMHHAFMAHGSDNNKTDTPRLALGLIFVATDARPIATYSPESTVMVSGVDNYNYMLHDPAPTGQFEYDTIQWRKAYNRQHDNYYKMEQTL